MANPAPVSTPAAPSPSPAAAPGSASPSLSTWESEIESSYDAPVRPAAAPAAPSAPPAKPAGPAPQQAPEGQKTPAAPSATPKAPEPPKGGRKAALDPDELLSVEGLEQVELPDNVVEALQKLDARDLRVQSGRIAKLARSLKAQLKQNESELAQARQKRDDPEKQALVEERAALLKKFEAAEQELRYTNYTKSDEYRAKFEKPFQDTLADAYESVKELSVEQEDGTVRQGTQKDFDRLLELPRGEAYSLAKRQFGDLAPEVLDYVRKIKEIQRSASRATEEYRKTGAEQNRRKEAEQIELSTKKVQLWEQSNANIVSKFPEHFGKDETDPDGNVILERGYKEVDKAFSSELPLEERIARQAANRQRAAAWPREVYRRKKAEARIKELETKLEELKGSVPAEGSRDGGAPPSVDPDEDAFAAIDKMATPRQ